MKHRLDYFSVIDGQADIKNMYKNNIQIKSIYLSMKTKMSYKMGKIKEYNYLRVDKI